MRLAIVIAPYTSAADIGPCLAAMGASAPSTPHEVAVVDNASTDGTAAFVRTRGPEGRRIEAGGNLGFALPNNLGIRATASELVLLLNPDTVPAPGAID